MKSKDFIKLGLVEGYQDDSKEREENLRYSRSRNPVADAIRKKLNPNQKPEKNVAEAYDTSPGNREYFDTVQEWAQTVLEMGGEVIKARGVYVAHGWDGEMGEFDPAAGEGWLVDKVMREQGVAEADAELAEPPAPERKQQTKTKQKSKLDPNMFGPKLDQPLAKTDPLDDLKKNAGVGSNEPKVNIKKASQADTLSKTVGIGSDDMANMLSRMKNIEVDRDLEAYPEPEPPETLPSVEVNTANLPAVAGQALQAAGVQNPDFHQVANLPGNISDQIRQLGKSLFGALTMTPTKRIHVVANLGGQGPNTTQEVNAVAGFLKEHGKDLGPGDIDFENVMPGYKADTHMFSAAGIRWMLVKDFAGQYIYCWPEEDSHDAADVIGMDKDVKQLR